MLPNEILQSDMLDILFENRNKNYGAYALRKSYNKTLASAVIGTFLIASAFTTLQLLHHPKTHDSVTLVDIIDDPHLTRVEVVKPEPVLPATPAGKHLRQTDHQTPVIVKEVHAIQQQTIEDMENSIISDVSADGDAAPDNPVTAGENNDNVQSSASSPAAVIDDVPVFNAQVMPEFPGGPEALRKFILKNTRQPDDLRPGEKLWCSLHS
jgi:protein TonB